MTTKRRPTPRRWARAWKWAARLYRNRYKRLVTEAAHAWDVVVDREKKLRFIAAHGCLNEDAPQREGRRRQCEGDCQCIVCVARGHVASFDQPVIAKLEHGTMARDRFLVQRIFDECLRDARALPDRNQWGANEILKTMSHAIHDTLGFWVKDWSIKSEDDE